MPNKLFIRALSLAEEMGGSLSNLEWGLYAPTGEKIVGGSAPQFADIENIIEKNDIDDVQVIGLIPANFVNSTQVTLPGKSSRFVQQAIPFAVEDQLADDLDDIHIALGGKSENGRYSVEIVNRRVFENFFQALNDTGYPLVAIYTDASLLPLKGTNVVIGFEGDWALINTAQGIVSRIRRINMTHFFESVLQVDETAEQPEIQTVDCFFPPAQLDALQILLAELQQIEGFEWSNRDLEISMIDLLCESWFQQGTKGINLCQGDFKMASHSASALKNWIPVAIVASAWFFLQVGLDIGKGYYYQNEADQYRQQALHVYKDIFPGERRVTAGNLGRNLKAKLSQASTAGGANDFLTLLGEIGYQYSQIPDRQSVQFNSVNFSDQRQELTIELRARSFQQLNQLKNGLTSAGLGAKIGSAINEQNSVRGRLSVTGS